MQQKQKNQKNARTSNTKAKPRRPYRPPWSKLENGLLLWENAKTKAPGSSRKVRHSLGKSKNKEQRRKQGITVGSVFWVLTLELFLGSVYVYFGFAARIIWNRIRFILWV